MLNAALLILRHLTVHLVEAWRHYRTDPISAGHDAMINHRYDPEHAYLEWVRSL